MAWQAMIEHGDTVETPHGRGQVRNVSEANKSAQVEVNGQLYDVPMEAMVKSEAEDKDIEGEQPVPQEGVEFKEGDRVQHNETEDKATVTEVTQRTVKVKYDSGNDGAFPKKTAHKKLDKLPEDDKPEPKTETPEQTVTKTGDGLAEIFKLKEYMESKIDKSVDQELHDIKELAKKNQKLEINANGKKNVIEGLKHKQLEQLIKYAALRLSPLLVGMAGTGKTHAGQQTSEALGLDFYAMSVGAQTSKSDIIGYMDASGRYVQTHFRTAYENGGVFLMDEIDAGNANVLIQVNAALSNGLCAFPDKMVERHPDFVFIASANTFGNGANRQYVGRNQLDAATLDRFAVIEWFIDDELESHLTTGINGKAWYMAVRAARDYVAEKNIRALVSPRATQKGSQLLDIGQDLDEVINATLLSSVPEDKKPDVKQVAHKVFNKFASDVPNMLPNEVDPSPVKVDDIFAPF